MGLLAQLKGLNGQPEAMIDTIVQWSNINSHTFNVSGLDRVATLIKQAFDPLDCEHETLSLNPIEQLTPQGNLAPQSLGSVLRFWKRPQAPNQVLLIGHMDTVFDEDSDFQSCIRRSQNILNGPGVADMKGGVCLLIEALKTFEALDQSGRLGWEVLINPDEEIGSLGSRDILQERARSHQVGLLFEPAIDEEGTLAGQRKGSGRYSIVVHGHEAHAGRDFSMGRNAVVLLCELVTEIQALNGRRKGSTINVGRISGGAAVNVVPALAMCHLDIRIEDPEDEAWVQGSLDGLVSQFNERDGFTVELQGRFLKKPKIMTEEQIKLYELVADVGRQFDQKIRWKPTGGVSDGNILFAEGLINVDTLGVCGGGIHSDKEYLLVDKLIPRLKLVTGLLLRLSEGLPT